MTGPDPNNPRSSDEGDSGDDPHPTYDSQVSGEAPSGKTPSEKTPDLDATIESIDRPSKVVDSKHNDRTANTIERTIQSKTAKNSKSKTMRSPLPKSEQGSDATYDSQDKKPSDPDDFSALTEMSLDSPGLTGDQTRRAIETAGNIDATIDSVPGSMKISRNDDEFQFLEMKHQQGLPSHIGRYEIKRLLGEGTFGKVYEARDPQLDRIVAVKVAKSISGKTQITRFLREARAAAQLRHPRIIPVYEYGQVKGENIIVYEYVAGETLKAYLRRHKTLPLDEAVEIVGKIAEGLNYAHEQGIIHRDMKPDNVMIDPSGQPHIADFGCARAIEDTTNLTIDGSILGTPMYMSPEQAGGRSNVADGRTDIWSLGVMLYEMAAGEKPFGGQLSDLLFSICNKDPRPLRKIRPDIPADIETICNKCLTRDLNSRFATAKILADELGRYQRGEPIESRRIGPIHRTWMWAKRNQAVASLTAAVAITMLIGTILSSTFAIQAYLEKQKRANTQMSALKTSAASALPDIFDSLTPFSASILPKLKTELSESLTNVSQPETTSPLPLHQTQHRLRMAILELETDPELRNQLADEMVADLLVAEPGDFYISRQLLEFRKQQLSGPLWTTANDLTDSTSSGKRFRAATALALFDPKAIEKWEVIAPDVAGYLTSISEIEASKWLDSLRPVRDLLRPTLEVQYLIRNDESDNTPERTAAILSSMFDDDVEFLVSLVPDATPQQIPYLTSVLRNNQSDAVNQLQQIQASLSELSADAESKTPLATRKSNVVTMLIQLADQSQWNQLAAGTDRSTATELIERLGPASTPFELLSTAINQWESADSHVLSGILLSLGQFRHNQILSAQKQNLLPILLDIFTNQRDARVHSSARWVLQQWGFDDELEVCELGLRRKEPDPNMNWHVDLAGNTFALFGRINGFEMGLNAAMADGSVINPSDIFNETRHRKSIPRRFGICIHEVTVGQFAEFEADYINGYTERSKKFELAIASLENPADDIDDETKQLNARKLTALKRLRKVLQTREKEAVRKRDGRANLDKKLPVAEVDYFKSLAYCAWLNKTQLLASGIPSVEELQNYYLQYPSKDYLCEQSSLAELGYRLPTATEWEYACRGGSETIFPFGQSTERANRYSWYATNSGAERHRVGMLKPGNSGLFDVLGNVSEWCLDWYHEDLPKSEDGKLLESYVDFGPELARHQSDTREFRGGSFENEVDDVRSTIRFSSGPNRGYKYLGFRLARTYPLPSGDQSPSEIAKTETEKLGGKQIK